MTEWILIDHEGKVWLEVSVADGTPIQFKNRGKYKLYLSKSYIPIDNKIRIRAEESISFDRSEG